MKEIGLETQSGVYTFHTKTRIISEKNNDPELSNFALIKQHDHYKVDFQAFLIINDTSSAQEIIHNVSQVSKQFQKNFSFFISSKDYTYSIYRQKEIFRPEDSFLAVRERSNSQYFFRFLANFSLVEIENFLSSILNGTAEPNYLSQEDPGDQSNISFKKAVTNTLPEIISDNNFDTFLIISASWCGHCKNAKKHLTKLADDLINTTIRFYDMDGILNDVPEYLPPVRGFPTMLFWSIDKKDANPAIFHVSQHIEHYTTLF